MTIRAARGRSRPARLLITGARVVTCDSARPRASAIVLEGDRIAAVGGPDLTRAMHGVPRLDLDGGVVVPGLVDAHLHFIGLGLSLADLDLGDARSAADVASRVAQRAAGLPEGAWITGRGWNQAAWPGGRFPGAGLLDAAAGGRPVVLTRVDGHACWVSARTLTLAGIGPGTLDPAGGRILRDRRGRPTGVLIDRAMDAVWARRPRIGKRAMIDAALAAQRHCLAAGLTQVHDAGLEADAMEVLMHLYAAGRLHIRMYGMAFGADFARTLYPHGPRIGALGGRFTLRTVKLMADGALGSRGAALLRPYADEPGANGLLLLDESQIADLTFEAMRAGFQVATHAIGDRAVRATLRGYQCALARLCRAPRDGGATRAGAVPDPRLRLEHAQIVDPADRRLLRELGLVGSIQPIHATSDRLMACARLDRRTSGNAYVWRSLSLAGARLAGGSDAPVEDVSPIQGIHAARSRTDARGLPRGGWRPAERLDGGQALALYTTGPAYASFQEHRQGRIAPGFDADLTVLSDDPARVPAAEVGHIAVLGTMVAGRWLWGEWAAKSRGLGPVPLIQGIP